MIFQKIFSNSITHDSFFGVVVKLNPFERQSKKEKIKQQQQQQQQHKLTISNPDFFFNRIV
jgi:hypothetical protein